MVWQIPNFFTAIYIECRYTSSGFLVRTYTSLSTTLSNGLFIDRTRVGNRLVVDRGNPSKVIITDKNNNLINKLATGEGLNCNEVAIAPNGDVWVTHSANKIRSTLSSYPVFNILVVCTHVLYSSY